MPIFDLGMTHRTDIPELKGKIETPVFHCHGEDDQMISFERGQITSKALSTLVQKYEFHSYPYMGHEANQEEMDQLQMFIMKYLPPLLTPVDEL